MFIVLWTVKRGRRHRTFYNDAFAAVNAFRQHKRATPYRNGIEIASKKERS